jgi:hypothetical protein
LEIDPNQIQTLNDEMREDLEKRCRVMHITQIRQATMVRIEFQKSLRGCFSKELFLYGMGGINIYGELLSLFKKVAFKYQLYVGDINFKRLILVQSSGVRMLDRDPYKLAIKYEVNLENPPQGLRLRHW